jgi:DNA-binding MarR family transcriptional regulator
VAVLDAKATTIQIYLLNANNYVIMFLMHPNPDDVQQMVGALFGLIEGIKRAQKGNQAANRLALLQAIAAHGQINPSGLARDLEVNQSSITRQVQALEDEGHLAVIADPIDHRACIISLTEQGQEKLRSLTQVGLERFALFVADWDAEEVRTLTRLLRKLVQSKTAVARRESTPARANWRKRTRSNGR